VRRPGPDSCPGPHPVIDAARRSRVVGVFLTVESYLRLIICYLLEYTEDWVSERSYIREDKVLGSLERLHELTAQ